MPRLLSPHGNDVRLHGLPPRHGVAQVRNGQRLPGCITKAQGLGKDQVGPGQGLHAHTPSAQIGAMATIQGGQGGKQARLLARN